MHATSIKNLQAFCVYYLEKVKDQEEKLILEIGSGEESLKPWFPKKFLYKGVDLNEGEGVDIVLEDPYKYPFKDESIDFIVCSSVFEHVPMFWVLFEELLRILKPEGLLYLNMPSEGGYHRHPVDAWRFFPDCYQGLSQWGYKQGYKNVKWLEHYTCGASIWADKVIVYIKDRQHINLYPDRILNHKTNIYNGEISYSGKRLNPATSTQAKRVAHKIVSLGNIMMYDE